MKTNLLLPVFTLLNIMLVGQSSVIETALGIGTDPGSYKMKIQHGIFGFNIENSTTMDDWEFWSNSGGLSVYANMSFRGNFNLTTGVYTAVSDARLKTDIHKMPPVLTRISALKPYTYRMNDLKIIDQSESPSYGFIAQDVMTIFPHLVTHILDQERQLDVYTLDYSGFGVIAIKAIQELEEKIVALEKRLNQLEGVQNNAVRSDD
ncbi:MAG: tail fiber domain-containing protein [Saprospiraceae bacterium]|nr:tail fiber domain-containing protein [Saprospiraceae bacterium]